MQGVGALANAQKPKRPSLGLFPRRTPKTLPDVSAGTSPTQQLTRTGAAGSGRSRTAVSTERHEGCGPPREARGPQHPGTRDGGLDGCLVHGKQTLRSPGLKRCGGRRGQQPADACGHKLPGPGHPHVHPGRVRRTRQTQNAAGKKQNSHTDADICEHRTQNTGRISK